MEGFDDDDDDDDDVLHMRRFKCIGAEDETTQQEFLRLVEREMHEENVPVKARPRPEPRRKTREMQLPRKDHGTSWFCVGYIAKNLQSICTLILAPILPALAFISL